MYYHFDVCDPSWPDVQSTQIEIQLSVHSHIGTAPSPAEDPYLCPEVLSQDEGIFTVLGVLFLHCVTSPFLFRWIGVGLWGFGDLIKSI